MEGTVIGGTRRRRRGRRAISNNRAAQIYTILFLTSERPSILLR
jgi:hypothetical protein